MSGCQFGPWQSSATLYVEAEPLDLPLVPDDATLWEFQSRPPLVANPWFAWGKSCPSFMPKSKAAVYQMIVHRTAERLSSARWPFGILTPSSCRCLKIEIDADGSESLSYMQEKIDHNERQNGSNEPGLLGVRQYRPDENRRSQMGQQQPCQFVGCLAPELSRRRITRRWHISTL
jgi:hypothetical protein